MRALRPVVAGLRALGHDADAIVAAAGLDASALDDLEGRVPHGVAMRLWSCAVAVTGDDDLGLHVAEAAPIQAFDVHAYAMLSSPTLRDAFERAGRYQRLIHDTTGYALESEPGGERAILRHALPGGRPVSRHPAELLAALWLRFGRLVTGDDWSPLEVRFAHRRPAGRHDHDRIFRAPVRFGAGENAMVIARAVLDARNARSDLGLLDVLDRYAAGLLAGRPRVNTVSERVRVHLDGELSGGAPSAEACARALGMSVRTLRRALRAEGTAFTELLEQARRERAARLLAGDRASIAEVAFLLGFSELSAFYRAFRRWTGMTPAQFRDAGRTGQAS